MAAVVMGAFRFAGYCCIVGSRLLLRHITQVKQRKYLVKMKEEQKQVFTKNVGRNLRGRIAQASAAAPVAAIS
jgi:hypothetical protein